MSIMLISIERVSGSDARGGSPKPWLVTWRDEDGIIRLSYFRTYTLADSFSQDVIATARGR